MPDDMHLSLGPGMRPEDFLGKDDTLSPTAVESPAKVTTTMDPARRTPQADTVLTQSLEDQLLIDLSQAGSTFHISIMS